MCPDAHMRRVWACTPSETRGHLPHLLAASIADMSRAVQGCGKVGYNDEVLVIVAVCKNQRNQESRRFGQSLVTVGHEGAHGKPS